MRGRPSGRSLAAGLLLVALATLLVAGRYAFENGGIGSLNPFAYATAPAHARVPANGAIEDAWGIRFTSVNLLADGGMVELRYEVVDETRGGRIHRDPSLKDLPVIVSATGQQVTSHDLMFHIHRGMGGHDEGRAYSIVYGNSNGAVQPGAYVTIVMSDGLRLQHFPVSR